MSVYGFMCQNSRGSTPMMTSCRQLLLPDPSTGGSVSSRDRHHGREYLGHPAGERQRCHESVERSEDTKRQSHRDLAVAPENARSPSRELAPLGGRRNIDAPSSSFVVRKERRGKRRDSSSRAPSGDALEHL